MEKSSQTLYETIKRYHSNATLLELRPLKNGLAHGIVMQWDKTGKPLFLVTYENGKAHGRCKYWNDYDDLFNDRYFINNIVDGECVEYDNVRHYKNIL